LPTTPSDQTVALAHFKALAGPDKDESIAVHFNPASLQYTVSNTQDQQRQNAAGVQFVTQTTAKLTMDLLFDTTLTGEDVRVSTEKIAKLMRPYQEGGGKVPPSVEFGWGTYTFNGVVEQYKETLEFFSAGGVPLRASINLTLSSNAVVFESSKNPRAAVDGNLQPEPVVLPDSAGPSAVANGLGDPRAARAIAAASGSASLRFGGGASLGSRQCGSVTAGRFLRGRRHWIVGGSRNRGWHRRGRIWPEHRRYCRGGFRGLARWRRGFNWRGYAGAGPAACAECRCRRDRRIRSRWECTRQRARKHECGCG
jgi:hypothetical protein